MKKLLKRIGIGVLILVIIVCATTYVRFTQWRNEVTKNLLRDSTVVQTARRISLAVSRKRPQLGSIVCEPQPFSDPAQGDWIHRGLHVARTALCL